MLQRDEITRYSRNILLPEIGRKGQEVLKSSTVAVVGCGGLGSPILFYLAAAGVGNLRLIDSDVVDLTNLQRQILYPASAIGQPKAEQAAETLRAFNPFIEIESHVLRLQADNAESLLGGCDLVLEGADNFATKFLVNDACYFLKIPLLTAGILQFEGLVQGIIADVTACYRCVFHSPPPPDRVANCAQAGVIGSMAGVIGSIQATEAIQFLINHKKPGANSVFGHLLSYQAKNLEFRKISIRKNHKCPLCGDHREINQLIDHDESCNF